MKKLGRHGQEARTHNEAAGGYTIQYMRVVRRYRVDTDMLDCSACKGSVVPERKRKQNRIMFSFFIQLIKVRYGESLVDDSFLDLSAQDKESTTHHENHSENDNQEDGRVVILCRVVFECYRNCFV